MREENDKPVVGGTYGNLHFFRQFYNEEGAGGRV